MSWRGSVFFLTASRATRVSETKTHCLFRQSEIKRLVYRQMQVILFTPDFCDTSLFLFHSPILEYDLSVCGNADPSPASHSKVGP